MDGSTTVGERSKGSRKRARRKTKREHEMEKRYANRDPDLSAFESPCGHKEGLYRCGSIPAYFLQKARNLVFSVPKKLEQDRRLGLMMKVSTPKLPKPGKALKSQIKRKIVVKYGVKTGDQVQPVCSKFFKRLFGLGQTRLNTIANGIKSGVGVTDKRGGNRKEQLYAQKKKSVIEFIKKLEATESHYGRNKSRRLYLTADLNINKLFELYNSKVSPELKVKKWYFQNIFRVHFNIGFGTPATDTCSYCSRMTWEVKNATADDLTSKQHLLAELGAHKFRAKQFYKLMKECRSGTVAFCFDLQQVQPLPKLSIGEAYYSRQISFYALCITDIQTKSPKFYTWDETQAGRGANEVASGIVSFLEESSLQQHITCIKLFCDGCGGQNKNMHVVHALAFWLQYKAPHHICEIAMHFPVRGHSFLPADRVFGVVEKALCKKSEIITPADYRAVYAEVGTVKSLGDNWAIRDYKSLSTHFRKVDGIKDMKRVLLNRKTKCGKSWVTLKMEPTFRCDDPSKLGTPVAKRGVKTVREPPIKGIVQPLSDAKKKDIDSLLTARFGANWRERDVLRFYGSALSIDGESSAENNESVEQCDCLVEESGFERL